jgi:hyperosmotically inducible periplasmic protein
MRTIKVKLMTIVAAVAIAASTAIAVPAQPVGQQSDGLYLMNKVRKELVTLPYYGVFDNLAYKIDGSTVTLYGQVVRPSTRSSAEKRIKKIEGVDRVVNNIEVLPLSTFDNSIRARAYRAVFRSGSLYRYGMGANPSIHIIVNRGHITLEGVVANEGDSRLAYIAARGVPGAFSVKNNLRVERKS